MRIVSISLILLLIAGVAVAQDLGSLIPDAGPKPPGKQIPSMDKSITSGGDTIIDAVVITSLPFTDTGNTCGFADDYDEVCPDPSAAPDVVYSFTPVTDTEFDVDLCGSNFDTKVYVYDSAMTAVACSDDYYFGNECGSFNAAIWRIPAMAGETYYIVIDGYDNSCGTYELTVGEYSHCRLTAPAGAILEGEPEPLDEYVDLYNSGCDNYADAWSVIYAPADNYATFYGASGYYTTDGMPRRETDWFKVYLGPSGTLTWTVESEHRAYMYVISPHFCEIVGVEMGNLLTRCDPLTLTVEGNPGDEIWLWFGPRSALNPYGGYVQGSFNYVMTLDGIQNQPVSEPWETGGYDGPPPKEQEYLEPQEFTDVGGPGDTVNDPFIVPGIPYSDAGSTNGFANDYDEIFGYAGSFAPDVVYRYVPSQDEDIAVDLCGSSYDTKVYIYDGDLAVVAGNDDYYFETSCGNYVSKINHAQLYAGNLYFIIVDGFGLSYGDYQLEITEAVPCDIQEISGNIIEGEPPLHDGYVDVYNRGCYTDSAFTPQFQLVEPQFNTTAKFSGSSGWYITDGDTLMDVDYFLVYKSGGVPVFMYGDAEEEMYLLTMTTVDCDSTKIWWGNPTGQCEPNVVWSFNPYTPNQPMWLQVRPVSPNPPEGFVGNEFNYTLYFKGITMAPISGVQEMPLGNTNFRMYQNYPNPFNPQTTISFSLKRDEHVRLDVYSLDGRRVRTLVDGPVSAGPHDEVWNGRDDQGALVASGAYLYRMTAGSQMETRRMVLLK